MKLWEAKNIPVVISRWLIGLLFLVIILGFTQITKGALMQDNQNDWQAIVKTDSLNIYTEASTQSAVVKSLKKGDVVIIALEIVSMEGTWCGVREVAQVKVTGYVRDVFLERNPDTQLTAWQYLPPPPPPEEVKPEEIKPNDAKKENRRVWIPIRKTEVKHELDKLFISKYGRTLPVSAFGQTVLHTSLNYDHRNSFDIAVHPDSAEGRTIITYLRGKGLPFIVFRSAVRGSATGPHIHVGNPSPRMY
ncbi:MAG: SH3 domain-containing protein [Acidobacteriota bacterium]